MLTLMFGVLGLFVLAVAALTACLIIQGEDKV